MFYNNIFIIKNNIKNILNIYKKSINQVGIKDLYYPIIFDNNIGRLQKSVGLWNFNIFLNSYKRGTHMSRFIEILDNYNNKPLNIKIFYFIHKLMSLKLESNIICTQVSFMYFLKKYSPISRKKSLMNYKVTLLIKHINIRIDYILKINIPINSLCPCSKLISIYNAHNQRSYVLIFLKIKKNLNINTIINMIEKESSSELWTILKRSDEKFITEFSYKNPKFVEDLIRNISKILKKNKYIISFIIKVENFESIHNHNVYAVIKN